MNNNNKSEFKIGDKVICIDTTTDFEGHPDGQKMYRENLQVGGEYIIEDYSYNEDLKISEIKVEENIYWTATIAFRLANQEVEYPIYN